MFLTQASRLPLRDSDNLRFPTTQLFLLALVRLAEPIALTSLFPYAWKAVLHYNVGDKHDAAFYAGILIAAFSFAEACSGMYWGGLSDKVGRKPVLLLGCAGTLLSLLIVGFAQNFWVALFGRLLGGLLNGNIGVIQTMVGELCVKPEWEPRAFAVMPFVWSIGTIVGPSIGGYFADPSENFPEIFSPTGLFATFPYLLPNLLCAMLLLGSIVAGYVCLQETHPDLQPWSTQADLDHTSAETPLLPAQAAVSHPPTNLSQQESYGTFDAVNIEEDPDQWMATKEGSGSFSSASSGKPYTKAVMMVILALGIFTYHSMAFDHLLPIFLQDARIDVSSFATTHVKLAGGLGLSIQQVGIIMSINGMLALFVQAIIFPLMASWLGVWRLFVLVTIVHPVASFVVPYLVVLPEDWVYTGVYSVLLLRNFSYILAYPLLLILIKEAAPSPSQLGKINGLAASTGGACRTLASPIAGLLYGVGSDIEFSGLAWWFSAVIAVVGVLQIPFIQRQKNKTAHVQSAAAWRQQPQESNDESSKKSGVPVVTVEEVYDDDV